MGYWHELWIWLIKVYGMPTPYLAIFSRTVTILTRSLQVTMTHADSPSAWESGTDTNTEPYGRTSRVHEVVTQSKF